MILVIVEGVLRIAFPHKISDSSMFDPIAYEFNDDYLISLKPNIEKKFTREEENGGYTSLWKTNNDSFRGEELRENPSYRIMVYGDSNIQARFSGERRTFPGQLSRYLYENTGLDVEVINGGVVGFGPDQVLIRMSKELDTYKPDLVVFHVFADNDFGDIIRNRLFNLDKNGNLTSTGYAKKIDNYLLISKEKKQKKFISRLLVVRALKKTSATLLKTNMELNKKNENLAPSQKEVKDDVINQWLMLSEMEYFLFKNAQPRRFSHFSDHYDIDIALHPNKESSKIKVRLMDEVIKNVKNLADTKEVKLLVLIQPSIIDVTTDNFIIGYDYLEQYTDYKRTNLTDAVEKICVSHNLHSVNLFDIFMENNPEDLFFRGKDGHWNDRGQQLAAKETARYINSHLTLMNNQPR